MIEIGDYVRNDALWFSGRVIGLHGSWVWVALDIEPDARPLSCLAENLKKIVPTRKENRKCPSF